MSGQQVDALAIFPMDGENDPVEMLTPWISGSVKPAHDGAYLRQFSEGEALSWWYDGQWNMDSFFAGPSDIQDAPWRGVPAALANIGLQS